MLRVLIVQAQMKHYRTPFFLQLHTLLQHEGIDLQVAYSAPHGLHATVTEDAELPPSFGRKVKAYWLGGRLIYQPLWKEIARADLVITGHENKYLMNAWLFLLSALRLKRVALWGLGECKEEGQSRLSRWLREKSVSAVDWYFAYTQGIVPYLRRHGMPADRITVVQNAVDTVKLHDAVENITEEEVRQARAALGIGAGPVGIYCGILEPTKHVPFLISAAHLIREQLPGFNLLIVGDGPQRSWVEGISKEHSWIHYLGPKYGREKALALRISDAFLLPGRVGLAILDTFAAGLPFFTTDLPIHCPEIEYLRDGENGRRTPNNPQAYAAAVVETLASPELLKKMRHEALGTAERCTIEAMAANFQNGIRQCLGMTTTAVQPTTVLQNEPTSH